FLLLGLDKHADAEALEAHWAERLKLARRQQLAVSLVDINWARDNLRDPERRIRADVTTLNIDLRDRYLGKLAERFQAAAGVRCQPIDVEKNLAKYQPPIDLPDADAVRAAIPAPEIPEEFPAALRLLEEFVAPPVDPWALPLPVVSPAGN